MLWTGPQLCVTLVCHELSLSKYSNSTQETGTYIVLKLNSKNLSTTGFFGGEKWHVPDYSDIYPENWLQWHVPGEFLVPVGCKGEEGELLLTVDDKVWRRMSRKETVRSSITSMGFPLLQNPGEMWQTCGVDRATQNPEDLIMTNFWSSILFRSCNAVIY
jgi:hypothetical protein